MLLELARFLAGALIIMLPGIFLASARRMGRDFLETCLHGACLGLALAIYLAVLVSHFDLRGFYPCWAGVGLFSLLYFFKTPRSPRPVRADPAIGLWMVLVLTIVAVTRYAIALPQVLPDGWDPSFHSLLARKIQLANHAISDWTPFESVALNYPTGSHTLLAVLSTITGLPVHLVFKDLIPLLGVLTTGQIFLLIRCVTSNSSAALLGALAYGMWADFGSINYYSWGGLPNEMAMLLFLAMLVAWLEPWPMRTRLGAMSILYAATVLTHHHVMLTSAAILAVLLLWPRRLERRPLLLAGLAALVLDAFFLAPYAANLTTLGSTHVLHSGEPPVQLWYVVRSMGWAFLCASLLGISLILIQRQWRTLHPIAIAVPVTLVALYAFCEYACPVLIGSTVLTPSRFPTDLSSFLAIYAGLALVFVQQKLRLAQPVVLGLMLLSSLTLKATWTTQSLGSGESPDFRAACAWVRQNTAPNTLVICDEQISELNNQLSWIPYLTWRRAAFTPLPASEPLDGISSPTDRIRALASGNGPLDSPVVIILGPTDPLNGLVLWRGASGLRVVLVPPRR